MSFLKDSSYYSSATIVSQFITFIRGMGVRLLLGPEALGIYNYVQVIVGFIGVIDLGANVLLLENYLSCTGEVIRKRDYIEAQ